MRKLSALLILGYLYKVLKKPYKEHPFYDAGIIDENGNMLIEPNKMSSAQKKVYTVLNKFSFSLKKILDKNPTLKAGIIGALFGSIFMKESASDEIDSPFVLYNGKEAIKIKTNRYNTEAGLVELVTEEGVVVTGKDNTQEIDLLNEEIANSTAYMAIGDTRDLVMNIMVKRKALLRKKKNLPFLIQMADKNAMSHGSIIEFEPVAPKDKLKNKENI